MTGVVVAAAILVAVLAIPSDSWITWFAHPIRTERLGHVPEETVHGVGLLRMLAIPFAIAWVGVPLWLGRRRASQAVPSAAAPAMSQATLLLVALVTAVGVLLRMPRLLESLWYDEIAAMLSCSLHGPGPALGNYHALANHALHSALAAWSLEQFGGSDMELAIRLPAFLAGVVSIPAMFALGRAVDDDRLGLLAAALLAIMPVAILESSESRGYSLMILFAILATHQWLRVADGRRGAVGWYAVCVAAGCWSHLVFACVPLGHAMQAAIRAGRHREDRGIAIDWFAALALGGVTTLLLLSPLLPDLLSRRTEFVAIDGDEPSVFGIEGFHAVLQLGGSWTWWAAVPGLGLLLLGFSEAWRWPRLRLAAFSGLAGGVVCLVATVAGGSWLYARFSLFLIVPATLLVAAAIRGAGQFLRRHEPAVIAGVALVVTWSVGLALLPPKQPIREGVDRLREEIGTDATAWSIGLGDDVAAFYTEGVGPRLMHAPELGRRLDADALEVGPDAAIVLYPGLLDARVLDRFRAGGFREIARFPGWLDWGEGDVAVWVRASDGRAAARGLDPTASR